MRYYKIEQEILELLKKFDIDTSTFAIGTGGTFDSKSQRFIFRATNKNQIVNKTAKYAVKYFDKYKIYILWEVYGIPNKTRNVMRSKFSIDASKIINSLDKIDELQKGIEFKWKNTETVRVFDKKGLENYIKNSSKKYVKEI